MSYGYGDGDGYGYGYGGGYGDGGGYGYGSGYGYGYGYGGDGGDGGSGYGYGSGDGSGDGYGDCSDLCLQYPVRLEPNGQLRIGCKTRSPAEWRKIEPATYGVSTEDAAALRDYAEALLRSAKGINRNV
jgi:hypothetical protein